jgi:gliding motility-associated-like protein
MKSFLSFFLLAGIVFSTRFQLVAQCPTIQMSGSSVSCYGDLDGTAAVTITGGLGPFVITWSTGATGTNISGLAAGTYTVNVKSETTGCTVLGAFTVNSPGPLAISSSITNVNCFGGNNGLVDISVSGGTLPYTFAWSNGATSEDLVNAPAGNYSVTVTDFRGCQLVRNFTVAQPAQPLGATMLINDVNCFGGANGSIDLSVFGGTPPYTFAWNNGAITEDISTLTAGLYSVSITDSRGCTANLSGAVNQPSQLSATTSSSPVSCFGGSNGLANVLASGGTPPYNYAWQSSFFVYSVNNATLSDVPSDNYTVQITDSKGCQISAGTTVGTPPMLVTTISGTDVSCHGGTNGSITLNVNGGTPGYSFAWTNQNGAMAQITQNLNNIPAGTYQVVVTDNNGCTSTQSIEIRQPEFPLTYTHSITEVDCYNTNTGAIQLAIQGGTPGYFINWSNGGGSTLNANLFSGSYSVSILDFNGCSTSGIFFVPQPADTLMATHVITPVNCFGESNGVIDMNPSGGTAPYTYSWNNSSYQLSVIAQDLVGFPADTYYFEMIDAKNCVFRDTMVITQPPLLTGSISETHVLCKGNATGALDLTVQGGVQPYAYAWSNGQTTQDLANLIAGAYSVVITDLNNCTLGLSATITEPLDSLDFTFSTVDVKCHGGNDGVIYLVPEGGTTPYFIDWSNGAETFTNATLTAGMYSFVLTDNNGCWLTDSMEIFQPEPLLANEQVTDVTCFGLSDGIVDISPSGGTAPYSFTWYNSTFTLSIQEEDLVNFPAEMYQLVITDSLLCTYQIFIELPQPEPLTSNFETTNVTCSGGTDGDINLEIYGGNPGYTFQWSNGSSSQSLNGVTVGNYTVTVTDTKDCQLELTFIIYEPNPVTMSFATTDVSCIDQLDGTATVFPVGGTGNYTYQWQTGSTSDFADNLVGGTYWVTVTDIVGCTGTDSVFVSTDYSSCINPPNAFTPNGDNYNDTWVIQNIHLYPEFTLKIFNRWGSIVNEQNGEYIPWDGTFKGEVLPTETYYYILLIGEGYDPFKGTLTIVR